MSVFFRLIEFIFNEDYRFAALERRGFYDSLSDEEYIKKKFKSRFGKEIDLKNPKTFNEKTNWLKLYDRSPVYTIMADKYAVKEYVSQLIGEEFVIPSIGIWDKYEDIDFTLLPEQFVIKTTHDSGGVVVCKDKKSFNYDDARKKINQSLKRNYYLHGREWPYKDVPHRVLVERYMQDGNNDCLPVYKFFCFSGEPRIIQVIQNDKQPNETIDYMDTEWKRLDIKQNFPNSNKILRRPEKLDQMIQIARKLAGKKSFIRVDLYAVNERVYFSEFTFFSDSGFAKFYPESMDRLLGDWIKL